MKLFFQPPTSRWWIESGWYDKWTEFMAQAPKTGVSYTLVDSAAVADVAIAPWGEQGDGPATQLLRPLSRQDVRTVVWDMSDRPSGRQSGFYCSLPRRLFDPRRHCSISYPVPFNDQVRLFPPRDADLDFGFIGSMTAGVRRRIVHRLAPMASKLNATIIDTPYGSAWWSAQGAAPKGEKESYAEFIRRTRFVLCPRGQGVGSMRLFEVMKAGRVPIIISDDYVLPALRGDVRWADGALFVKERQLREIPALVQRNLDSWEPRARAARSIWEQNFSERAVLEFIATNLARLGDAIAVGEPRRLARQASVTGMLLERGARGAAASLRGSLRRKPEPAADLSREDTEGRSGAPVHAAPGADDAAAAGADTPVVSTHQAGDK
jgi:hypothetical protein